MLGCCWSHGYRLVANTCARYIQKFYQMRTQLQAISLRIQVRESTIREGIMLILGRLFAAMSR
jgi:division protein CdvB (Snf7/Vps24/ESCRT-III family)